MHRTLRRWTAGFALVVLPALGLTGLSAPAAESHEGHEGADAALDWSHYERTTLTKTVGEPIDLAVMPDSRVLHTARNGDLRMTDPSTGVTRVVNHVDVYNNSEMGLQTVTLDPDFAENKWVYLYYSPPLATPAGAAPLTLPAGEDESYWDRWKGYDQLARFKWTGGQLDLSSKQEIIRVDVERGQCCHVGGDVDFDADGNLYLSTGDNTAAAGPNVNGYAPTNDAPGYNPGLDTRRGAGSTNDLRGKILRIHPGHDGGYTIPDGNLFPEGTEKTRPEIYVMGVRNPFRIDVDATTGAVSWGDYGPDAGTANPNRGPMGYVEWQTTSRPMNSGWPFCTGDNSQPYRDFDFATLTPGDAYDCAAPVNDSRLNTGLTELPAAVPATLWYGDRDTDQPWPELTGFSSAGGQGPMGGPVYDYDADNPSTTKFPEYWDGKAFFGEFSQDYVAAFTLDGPDGPVSKLENFLPNASLSQAAQPVWDNPMDMEFGPDGSLYVLDYGDGFFRQNPDAGLYRVDYAEGNKAPTARMTASPASGQAPLDVRFSGADSTDPEGGALQYQWDFDGDGTFDATGSTTEHTYTDNGQTQARLKVTDPQGRYAITSRQITVGNTEPTVTLASPTDGGFFSWGDAVPYAINVDDPEDGSAIDCARAAWTFGIGHNEHAHPLNNGTGCAGAVVTPTDEGHGETENVFGVLSMTYTDRGANGVPAATGETQVVLNPKQMEAEHADTVSGVTITDDDGASGARMVTSFDEGDWIAYDPVNLSGIDTVQTTANGAGTLQLRWNSPDAEPFETVGIPAGDGWQTVTSSLSDAPAGTGKLYVTSSGGVSVDAFTFVGDGVADRAAPNVTASLSPAEPNGTGGWYTSNVGLTVTATDNGTVSSRQYSVDGGTTWAAANNAVTLAAEGATTVLYRATDNGGNVSETGSITVKIDKSGPTVEASGLTEGTNHGDSARPELAFGAADTVSGGATATAALDGQQVSAGPLDLWRLPLGAHELVVTGKDTAGNAASRTVKFTTGTSFADVKALVKRFHSKRLITGEGAVRLVLRIEQARVLTQAGHGAQANKALDKFIAASSDRKLVKNSEVSAALVRDAKALKS